MIFHTFLVYLQILLQNYGTNQCLAMHWLKHKCAVKVNGTDRITVRNRATLRRILSPVPVHKPISVQAPVMGGPSAVPAESRQRAVPPGSVGRAGLRSGDRPSHNIIVSGDNAGGSGGQK